MFTIRKKEVLSTDVKLFVMDAPEIAAKHQAGQFIILRIDETGERIPLTIADSDPQAGTITLIFQEVGKTTRQLGALKEGDGILDLVGPLGHPTEIGNLGTVVCVGGGIGVAPLYPITKALQAAGNRVLSVIGARNKDLLIWEDKMKSVSEQLYVTTDDGSYGRHGFVTQQLQDILGETAVDQVFAIGPVVMMKAVVGVTKPVPVPTTVSLNPVMVDGTGMCGGCRVTVGGEVKFGCVDGPEFDGLKVDFDELMQRQRTYHHHEKCAMEQAGKE